MRHVNKRWMMMEERWSSLRQWGLGSGNAYFTRNARQRIMTDFIHKKRNQPRPIVCRRGAANHMFGIHLAVIIATFLGPRWKTFQNLSQIDETNKDAVKFKVLELKKLAEAGARVVSQP